MRPSKDELRALRKIEKDREDTLRWQYYETIPAAHWSRMAGKSREAVVNEAVRHDFPLDTPKINLRRFVLRFHEFLAQKRAILEAAEAERDGTLNWGDFLKREQALLKQLDRKQREKELVDVEMVRTMLDTLADGLKQVAERMERQLENGKEAREMLNDYIEEFGENITRFEAQFSEL